MIKSMVNSTKEEEELLVNLLDKPLKKLNKAASGLIERYYECRKEGKKDLAPYDLIFLKNLQEAIRDCKKIITKCSGINDRKIGDIAMNYNIENLSELLKSANAYFSQIKKNKNLGEALEASEKLYRTLTQIDFICANLSLKNKW